MKKIKLDEVKTGMTLAVPIYMGGGDVELLSAGVEITQRHIQLMERLGIEAITVKEADDEMKASLSNAEAVELIKRKLPVKTRPLTLRIFFKL